MFPRRPLPLAAFCIAVLLLPSAAAPRGGWDYKIETHNAGSRSAYEIGILSYRGKPLSPAYSPVLTPAGIFAYVPGRENWWKPASSPGWLPQDAIQSVLIDTTLHPHATSRDAVVAGETLPASAIRNGFYPAPLPRRRPGTPERWFYSAACRLWIDPANHKGALKHIETRRELALLVGAIEEYYLRTGQYPPTLQLLVIGPEESRSIWAPLVEKDLLRDAWNTLYAVEILEMGNTGAQGRPFVITSAGPDRKLSTAADNLTAPEPSRR